MLLTDARVVTAGRVLDPGWLRIDGGTIVEVGPGTPSLDGDERHELGGGWVVPGFIDLHMHGGGGHATLSADPAEIVSAAAFHRAHGTTRQPCQHCQRATGRDAGRARGRPRRGPERDRQPPRGTVSEPDAGRRPRPRSPPAARFRHLRADARRRRRHAARDHRGAGAPWRNRAGASGGCRRRRGGASDTATRITRSPRRRSMPVPRSSRTCSTRCVPGITASRGWWEPPSRGPTSSAS